MKMICNRADYLAIKLKLFRRQMAFKRSDPKKEQEEMRKIRPLFSTEKPLDAGCYPNGIGFKPCYSLGAPSEAAIPLSRTKKENINPRFGVYVKDMCSFLGGCGPLLLVCSAGNAHRTVIAVQY